MPHFNALNSRHSFGLAINNVEVGVFQAADGLSAEIDAIEKAKVPGIHKVGDVTLKRGVIAPPRRGGKLTLSKRTGGNPLGAKILDDWRRATPAHGSGPRKNGLLVVYDAARRPLGRLELTGLGLVQGGVPDRSNAPEETLTLNYEEIKVNY